MKLIYTIFLTFFFVNIYAQNIDVNDIKEVEEEEEIIEDVPFKIIEEPPVFPGCETAPNNVEKKKCLNLKIQKHVSIHFNADLANCVRKVRVYNALTENYDYECEGLLSGKKKIYVIFKINEKGYVTNITARGPHPRLEEEAIRVIKKLPRMIPGKQRHTPVRVGYTLPIIFNVE